MVHNYILLIKSTFTKYTISFCVALIKKNSSSLQYILAGEAQFETNSNLYYTSWSAFCRVWNDAVTMLFIYLYGAEAGLI